jgi:uncharacterized protein
MRQASGDLFPTDVPIPASQMIGRRDDVREVTTALMGATNLVLAGPRRTGKTSVCEAALTECRGQGAYTIHIDLFRIPDTAVLAEALALGAIANRSTAHRLVRRARELGRAALSAAQAAAVFKLQGQLGDGLELALTPGWAAQDPKRALTLALELPERIATADGKRMVLFFDEFQELAGERKPYGDPDQLTKQMRAVFQRSTSVSHLFAGSIEHVMRDLFAPQQRAFSGFGSFHALRPISIDEWQTGLAERFAADDCSVTKEVLRELIDLGAGHPRATMRIAQQTHLTSVQLQQQTIDRELLAIGYEAALTGDLPTMEQTVEQIRRLHKNALVVARSVAAAKSPPRRLSPAIRDRVLNLLLRAGIVEHVGRGDWRIVNPLFREYLRRLDPYTDFA